MVLLSTEGLSVDFGSNRAVDSVAFEIDRGEVLAVVGESGSGKSVTTRAILGLLGPSSRVEGTATWYGGDRPVELIGASTKELRRIRGRDIGLVFQNATQALNPTLTLRRQLTEHLLWHGLCGREEALTRSVRALGDVGIVDPERAIGLYPFQLSGGMRQRAMIAMALVARPQLVIADEPTTAVDATVQLQILDLLAEACGGGTSLMIITHDLGVARRLARNVLVMCGGQIVERGDITQIIENPADPYTRRLIGSALELDGPIDVAEVTLDA